jgi:hypothetical protein
LFALWGELRPQMMKIDPWVLKIEFKFKTCNSRSRMVSVSPELEICSTGLRFWDMFLQLCFLVFMLNCVPFQVQPNEAKAGKD